VNSGIQLVQQQKIFVTKRSVNIIKEQRNYMWDTDNSGKIINVPIGIFNHHMDGIRYSFGSLIDFIPDNVIIKQEQNFLMNQHRQTLNSGK
jgi:phage terminase large subunit